MDHSLLSLRAAGYRGTFKDAYSILTEMTSKIGWDQLLKIRSTVFVMEDEYRTEKQESSYPAAKRSPSLDALRGTPDPRANGNNDSDGEDEETDAQEEASTSQAAANGNDEVERPSNTIDPKVVKVEHDAVSFKTNQL